MYDDDDTNNNKDEENISRLAQLKSPPLNGLPALQSHTPYTLFNAGVTSKSISTISC